MCLENGWPRQVQYKLYILLINYRRYYYYHYRYHYFCPRHHNHHYYDYDYSLLPPNFSLA